MAIYFNPPPEPLAGPPGEESLFLSTLADTQASKRLLTILERYCTRQIAGRSVLIAGHRGAGKTTLVKSTIEYLRARPDLRGSVIPLYVQIHGPDLLGGETILGDTQESTASKTEADNDRLPENTSVTPANANAMDPDQRTKQKDQEEIDQARISLKVLTVALHRAFVTDLGWSFERAVSPELLLEDKRPPQKRSDGLQELAAQLRLDFDDLVETDSLRWIWKRAGILHKGILRLGAIEGEVARKYFSKQGLLEIVAASCVSDAYVRSVARVDDTDKTKAEAELRQSQEIKKFDQQKELANAIAGILAGGIAGSSVALNGPHTAANGALSGLIFLLSAAVTTTLLNYTSIRTRSKQRSKEKNIQWDRSIASLDLMLPLTLGRVLDAGRAPIFVIDELDKVNDIEEKLERLINRLKHIVADRALFCFLVDRSYFERIQAISRHEPHRKEHTFFSERLYVIATPAQWREYLLKVLQPEVASESNQRLALTYWLMVRSKMHAIDMRREIDALSRNLTMTTQLDLPDFFGPGPYRSMIYMQAVVEYVLEDGKLGSRQVRDLNFTQVTYDALYYLFRRWEQDERPAVIRNEIRLYLESRMSDAKPLVKQEPQPPQWTIIFREEKLESPDAPRLSEVDFGLLFSAIEQMATLLSDLDLFKSNVQRKINDKASGSWNEVLEMLPEKPLLRWVNDDWHWLFDISAIELQTPAPGEAREDHTSALQPVILKPAEVESTKALIDEVRMAEAAIRFFTEDRLGLEHLGNELRLLSIAPTYNSFLACASSYQTNAGPGPTELPYPSLPSDKSLIGEYSSNLRNALKGIQRSLFLAEFLAYETGPPTVPGSPFPTTSRRRTEMMRTIATILDFRILSIPELTSQLAEFKNEFEPDEGAIRKIFENIEQDSAPLDVTWVKQMQNAILSLFNSVTLGWKDWTDTYLFARTKAMVLHLRNGQPLKRLSFRELRIAAHGEVPVIHGDPDNIRLLDYAEALTATAGSYGVASSGLQLALLAKLGFGQQLEARIFASSSILGSELTADLVEAARNGQRAGERVLLVLGGSPGEWAPAGSERLLRTAKGEGSYAVDWKISKTHAVFPIHESDLSISGLSSSTADPGLADQLKFTIEVEDEGVVQQYLTLLRRASLGSPGIGRPQNLDEAVTTINTLYTKAETAASSKPR